MPNIAPINVGQPGAAADVVAAVKQKLGVVPNILATMAQSPAALEAYLAFGGAIEGASLSGKVREQIALAVAGVNECDYCASAHTFLAKSLKVDETEALQNLSGRASDAKTDAILQFAADIVRTRAKFSESSSVLNRLRNSGVTDAEIVEVIAVVALNTFTNYFNHIVETDIDFPHVNAATRRPAA